VWTLVALAAVVDVALRRRGANETLAEAHR